MVFKLDLKFHKNQQIVYDDPHRYKVVVAGRQFGKSWLACKAAVGLSLTRPETEQMVVAPYSPQAYEDFERIKMFIPERFEYKESAKWLTIKFKNKSRILMKSAENEVGLRGYTLDNLIMDEAGAMSREVWKILEPELAVRQGTAWIIGNPVFGGWFKEITQMEAIAPDRYKTFTFVSTDSEFFSTEEAEAYRETHTQEEYEQEILAKFLEGGAVFPHLKKIMTASPREPEEGHNYVTGADIASTMDFTVLKTFDVADHHEVNHQRFNKRDWSMIKSMIYATCKRYNNSTLFIDKTGVGAPVVEDLMKMDSAYPGAPVQGHLIIIPVIFSSVSKPQLYANYIMSHENGTIRLLPEPVTKKEHEDFIVTRTQGTTGYIKYSAPKGMHDDTVVAAALAAWGLDKFGGSNLAGPFTEEIVNQIKNPKKPIDPSCQIDVDGILQKMESKQISGFESNDDDLDICRDYT
jgi:hypothetical protein